MIRVPLGNMRQELQTLGGGAKVLDCTSSPLIRHVLGVCLVEVDNTAQGCGRSKFVCLVDVMGMAFLRDTSQAVDISSSWVTLGNTPPKIVVYGSGIKRNIELLDMVWAYQVRAYQGLCGAHGVWRVKMINLWGAMVSTNQVLLFMKGLDEEECESKTTALKDGLEVAFARLVDSYPRRSL